MSGGGYGQTGGQPMGYNPASRGGYNAGTMQNSLYPGYYSGSNRGASSYGGMNSGYNQNVPVGGNRGVTGSNYMMPSPTGMNNTVGAAGRGGVPSAPMDSFGPQRPGTTQGNGGPMDQFSTNAWNSPTMGQSTQAAPSVDPNPWNGMDNLTLSGRGTRSFVYDPATMGTDPRFQWGAVGQGVNQTRGQQAQMQLLDAQGNVVNQGGGFGRVGAFGTSGLTPGQTYNLMYDLPTTGAWNLIGNGGSKGPAPNPGANNLMDLLRNKQYTNGPGVNPYTAQLTGGLDPMASRGRGY